MGAGKNIVLFGLSANPPTGLGGHAGLVRWAATRERLDIFDGGGVDEVWVLPVYVHAYSEKRDMPRFEHRLEMARLAFEGLPGRVRVLDVEREIAEQRGASPDQSAPIRVGTIDVVETLQARHPEHRFALLLGADTYRDLKAGRWKASQALLARVRVLVIPRKGEAKPEEAPRDAPELQPVSSSEVRQATDEAFLARVLQPQVLDYIRRHGLYALGGAGSSGNSPGSG